MIEQKAGGCLLSVLFYRVVHPSDVIPFISEYLNAVPAIFSSGIHTSGKAHANLGQPIIENVLQMSAGCRPVIHNHFRQNVYLDFLYRKLVHHNHYNYSLCYIL